MGGGGGLGEGGKSPCLSPVCLYSYKELICKEYCKG